MSRLTRPRHLLTAAIAVAAVVLTACGGSSGDAGSAAASAPEFETIGGAGEGADSLPAMDLKVLGSSDTVTRDDLLGTPSVINFWATWCPFCVDEMPDLERAYQALGGSGGKVRFVGVDREDVADEAIRLAAETGVTYDLVEDPDASYFRALKGRGMPTTVLVDADGVIRYRHTGPLAQGQLLDLIEEHLGVSVTTG